MVVLMHIVLFIIEAARHAHSGTNGGPPSSILGSTYLPGSQLNRIGPTEDDISLWLSLGSSTLPPRPAPPWPTGRRALIGPGENIPCVYLSIGIILAEWQAHLHVGSRWSAPSDRNRRANQAGAIIHAAYSDAGCELCARQTDSIISDR